MGRPVLALQLTRHLLLSYNDTSSPSFAARPFLSMLESSAQKRGKEMNAAPKRTNTNAGVFKDLTSKVPLAWLGALPEAVVRARKEGATDDDVISLLGSNVDAESYEGDVCGDTLANTRCYAQMTKVKDEDLDSCGKSL